MSYLQANGFSEATHALADTEAKANETTREEKKVQKTDDEELKRQVAGGAGLSHHKLLVNRVSSIIDMSNKKDVRKT